MQGTDKWKVLKSVTRLALSSGDLGMIEINHNKVIIITQFYTYDMITELYNDVIIIQLLRNCIITP
jgi:hypothetical protein